MIIDRQAMKDRLWLQVSSNIATLGTCARRQVGCVFLDSLGRIMATGYNGVAPNMPHCIDNPCLGAGFPTGQGLDQCEAIHAEQNALTQCKFPDDIHTVYLTDSPCMHCVKMLSATGARRIVFSAPYAHSAAEAYWKTLGRKWEHIPLPDNPLCQNASPASTQRLGQRHTECPTCICSVPPGDE